MSSFDFYQETEEIDIKIEKIKYVIIAKEILEYFFNKTYVVFNGWEYKKEPIDLDQFSYEYIISRSTYAKVTHTGKIVRGTTEYKEIKVDFGDKVKNEEFGNILFFQIKKDVSEGNESIEVYMNQQVNIVLNGWKLLSIEIKERIIEIFNNNGFPITKLNFITVC